MSQQGLMDKASMPFTPPGLLEHAKELSSILLTGKVGASTINDAKAVLTAINKSIDEQDAAMTRGYQQAAKGQIVETPAYKPQARPIAPGQMSETSYMSLPPAQRKRLREEAKLKK